MTGFTADVLHTLFLTGLTAFLIALAGPLVVVALRSGRLLARGTSYHRETSPIMYWLGIVSWLTLIIVFGGLTVLGVAQVIGQLI